MEVLKNSAAVIVSHRLPICQLADKVVVMDEGRILECGSHEDLMKAPGSHYGRMFKSQSELYMGHGVLDGNKINY